MCMHGGVSMRKQWCVHLMKHSVVVHFKSVHCAHSFAQSMHTRSRVAYININAYQSDASARPCHTAPVISAGSNGE